MKVASYIAVIAIANLLLANVTSSVAAGDKGKIPHKQRGAVSTKSSKQSTNKKPQWSADPDRGWVWSDESHSIDGRDRLSTAPKQTDGKNKGSAKASKRF
jgi:hypothetical protein